MLLLTPQALDAPERLEVQESMYGKQYFGTPRATFVHGEEGVVRQVIPKASPKTHDDEVLGTLKSLPAG